MQAFITGSRAYGEPTDESDIDLVVYVSNDDLQILIDGYLVGEAELPARASGGDDVSASLRFGCLNLICVSDRRMYDAWLQGTHELKARGEPVSREEAIEYLSQKRFEATRQSAEEQDA